MKMKLPRNRWATKPKAKHVHNRAGTKFMRKAADRTLTKAH